MESYEDKYNAIIEQIVRLREVFPFDPKKDYDMGYPTIKKDGWQTALIVRSPEDCLEEMISYLKTNKK